MISFLQPFLRDDYHVADAPLLKSNMVEASVDMITCRGYRYAKSKDGHVSEATLLREHHYHDKLEEWEAWTRDARRGVLLLAPLVPCNLFYANFKADQLYCTDMLGSFDGLRVESHVCIKTLSLDARKEIHGKQLGFEKKAARDPHILEIHHPRSEYRDRLRKHLGDGVPVNHNPKAKGVSIAPSSSRGNAVVAGDAVPQGAQAQGAALPHEPLRPHPVPACRGVLRSPRRS